jgi:hypothetical protein
MAFKLWDCYFFNSIKPIMLHCLFLLVGTLAGLDGAQRLMNYYRQQKQEF